MRKIALAGMSTLSGLVLLFSYHTSLNQSAEAASATPATGSASTGSSSADSSSADSSATSSSSDDSASQDWAADDPTPSATSSASTGSTSSSSTKSSSSTSSAAKSTTSSSSAKSGTYTGDAVQTRWGLVQVQITVANGKITKAEAVQYPQDNPRDVEINSYAVPTLNSEVVKAQSASIDSVSGATVTSGGYLTSLQSALDQANL